MYIRIDGDDDDMDRGRFYIWLAWPTPPIAMMMKIVCLLIARVHALVLFAPSINPFLSLTLVLYKHINVYNMYIYYMLAILLRREASRLALTPS